jgi:hypothetical protein
MGDPALAQRVAETSIVAAVAGSSLGVMGFQLPLE